MLTAKYFLPAAGFLAVSLLLARGLFLEQGELPAMLLDKPLPSFALDTVRGEAASNADLPGDIFLLNVWGSYCLPCLVEHPLFMGLADEGEIAVVGVNYRDTREAALAWLEDHGDPYAFSLFDGDGRFAIDLGVYGVPETYLVDGDGILRHRHVGELEESEWQEEFLPLIAALRAGDAP